MRLALGLLLAASAIAQEKRDSSLQSELNRMDRQLKQSQSEVDRLLDLRLQRDYGLPEGDGAELFKHDGPVTSAAIEKAQSQLQSEERTTAKLQQEVEKLEKMRERMQADAPRTSQAAGPEWTSVPQPGSRSPRRPGTQPAAENPPAPAGETAAAVPAPSLNLMPVKGQIHGSNDHGRVCSALFRAAQDLMDRAEHSREQGAAAEAVAWDKLAKERLERAVDALQPALQQQPPAYADLFALGRCREALFRLAELHEDLNLRQHPKEYQQREQEVREPFVAITARDAVGKKGAETLGPWGRAAQTALDHFRWMNLHARFKPSRALESITWERERSK